MSWKYYFLGIEIPIDVQLKRQHLCQTSNTSIQSSICLAHGAPISSARWSSSTLAAWLLALAYICLSICWSWYWPRIGTRDLARLSWQTAGLRDDGLKAGCWMLARRRNRHGCNWLALVWLHSRSSRRRSRGNRTLVWVSVPSADGSASANANGSANAIANAIAIAWEKSVRPRYVGTTACVCAISQK